MTQAELFQEIVRDAGALLRGAARGPRKTVTLSPEVAALLKTVRTVPAGEGGGEAWAALEKEVCACTKCELSKTRRNTVIGEGNLMANLVFVGEAPGGEEDRCGRPFVGRAGQLLTDIIVKGMKLKREDVYICNVLKCRPPENRDPSSEEVACCEPFLRRQLDLIRPKVICALGRHAANTLLKTAEGTGRLRGKWHDYHGIPCRVTYHPSYLLHCRGEKLRAEKAKVWQDIQAVMKALGSGIATGNDAEGSG